MVDWESDVEVSKVIIKNRHDCCKKRLSNTTVSLLDRYDNVVGTYRIGDTSLGQIQIDMSEFTSVTSAQLEVFRINDKKQKWKFTNGTVESVIHPGMVLANNNNAIILNSNSESEDQSSNWIRVNTRLLDSNSATSGWKQQWKASFIDSGYKGPSLDGFIQNDNALSKHCYEMNPAFSASFDNFAKELFVNDPSDEDQCRKVREALGFDRDYPFDVEVSENYHEHQCDPFFSGVDHVSGNDMEALTVSVCHLLCLYR